MNPPSASAWRSWRHTICGGPVLGFAMLREASWSRSNSSWGMSQFKRPNATLGANSGFDQRSMIALASSRILELGARCGRVADNAELTQRQGQAYIQRSESPRSPEESLYLGTR